MANIGSINFSVDANTEGLQRAMKRLKDFEKATDRVSNSQKKGSDKVAAAMSTQEQAIRGAFQQLKNYQKTVQKSNTTEKQQEQQLARVNEAFQLLTRQMTNGMLKTEDFKRAVHNFNSTLSHSKRELTNVAKKVDGTKTRFEQFTGQLRNMESSAVLALGPLSGLGSRIRSIGAILGRTTGKLTWAKAAMLGLVIGAVAATIALFKIGGAAIRVGGEMQSLRLRFEAATGSMGMGAKRLQETIDLAKMLGLEVTVLTRSYSRFLAASQGTTLQGAKSAKIFTQVAKAAAALKLSGAEVEGVMRALEQMLSKGTIQAEELRGQLGDRLPGSFRIMAKAMGVTTRELGKMMKAGDLLSDEALPRFGDELEKAYGANAEKNINTLSGAMNNLKTNTFEWLNRFSESAKLQAISTWIIKDITKTVDYMTFGEEAARKQALAFDEAKEAILEYRTAADGLKVLVTDENRFTGKYGKLVEELDKATAALFSYGKVVDYVTNKQDGMDPTVLLDTFKSLAMLEKLKAPAQDLKGIVEQLRIVTGMKDLPFTVEGAAKGFAELARAGREANEVHDKLVNGPAAIGKLTNQIGEMSTKIEQFKRGADAFEIWEKVTKPAQEFGAAVLDVTDNLEVAASWQAVMNRLLLEWLNITKQVKEAATEKKNYDRGITTMANAIVAAWTQIDTLRTKLGALSKGPHGLMIFEKVELPLANMRASLLKAGVAIGVVNTLLKEFEPILRAITEVEADQKLAALGGELTDLQAKMEAFAMGEKAFEIWQKVTKPAEEYGKKVFAVKENLEDATKAQIEMTAALMAFYEMQKKRAKDEQDEKDRISKLERTKKVISEVTFEMDQLQARLTAMAKGPESLEMFEKVTLPLEEMRKRLEELEDPMINIEKHMERYEELLLKQFKMTDKWARANQRMADAIVNGLERVILEGESVKDMLHDLAKELLRVAVNAMFLDKLKSTLFGLFQGGAGPSMLPPGIPSGGGTSGGYARGGSFKLTGSGGSDKVPFFGMGKAGETVSIARADQLGASGGLGSDVTINQYNTFENSGGPETLIPILEENNRKLKGEILDGFDRGTFQ